MTIEPYNYNDEPSGRCETLVQALERCERLEKQLKIAVEALQAMKHCIEKVKRGQANRIENSLNESWGIEDLEKLVNCIDYKDLYNK